MAVGCQNFSRDDLGQGYGRGAEDRIALAVGSAAMPPDPFAALASMVG
jgi:hypothetical protein